MRQKFKFAAGERTGLKSSVWTVVVKSNDIYLSTELFGSHFKLSLHESGDSQWSYTSDYVEKHVGMKNQNRHLIKWIQKPPQGGLAINIFRIQIPYSELRNDSNHSPNTSINWVSGITVGTYQFDLCITPPSKADPCQGRGDLPHQVICSLQLANKRWLVIFVHAIGLSPVDVQSAKKSVILEMENKGINIPASGWIALFGESDDDVPFIMELYYDEEESKRL